MYAIKNEHGDFYTGNDYIFQGEKYANFTAYTDEVKTYRSLKIAENVKKKIRNLLQWIKKSWSSCSCER